MLHSMTEDSLDVWVSNMETEVPLPRAACWGQKPNRSGLMREQRERNWGLESLGLLLFCQSHWKKNPTLSIPLWHLCHSLCYRYAQWLHLLSPDCGPEVRLESCNHLCHTFLSIYSPQTTLQLLLLRLSSTHSILTYGQKVFLLTKKEEISKKCRLAAMPISIHLLTSVDMSPVSCLWREHSCHGGNLHSPLKAGPQFVHWIPSTSAQGHPIHMFSLC